MPGVQIGGIVNTFLIIGAVWLVLIVVVLVAWRRLATRRPRTVSRTQDRPDPRSTSHAP